MSLPLCVNNLIERNLEHYPLSSLKQRANYLSLNYLNNPKDNLSFIKDDVDAFTYLIMRFPATFGAINEVLRLNQQIIDFSSIKDVIDVGAGLGTLSLALDNYQKHLSYTSIEREEVMMNLNKELTSSLNVKYILSDIFNLNYHQKADLVSICYMINEIKEDQLEPLLDQLYSLSNDYVLIIDPGTPQSFQRIMKVKQYLINKGLNVLSPCPNNNPCPLLLTSDWCHFAVRIERSKIHKLLKSGDAPYEDEKFTYLLLSKKHQSLSYSRIMRHPIISSNHITIKTCNNDGIKEETIFKKELLKKYKKLKWGDIIK